VKVEAGGIIVWRLSYLMVASLKLLGCRIEIPEKGTEISNFISSFRPNPEINPRSLILGFSNSRAGSSTY
jgi:hypothetical protein